MSLVLRPRRTKHHMGFEPTPLAWKARILASILMVHFKLITWREIHTPLQSLCSILPIPNNYLSRYQLIDGFRKLITVPDQDKTFYKAVIGAGTYYTVKLIHLVLRTIDLICQPNFSVSYELTDFHISCFYKPEKES